MSGQMMDKHEVAGIDSSSLEKDSKAGIEVPYASAVDDGFENPTGIKEGALLRKLDLKLLPAVTILYLLSFLDRSNGIYRFMRGLLLSMFTC